MDPSVEPRFGVPNVASEKITPNCLYSFGLLVFSDFCNYFFEFLVLDFVLLNLFVFLGCF